MASWDDNNRLEVLRNSALLPTADRPLERQLLEVIPNDVQHVMIGEASHGTGEDGKAASHRAAGAALVPGLSEPGVLNDCSFAWQRSFTRRVRS
jgi:hypothetical protein